MNYLLICVFVSTLFRHFQNRKMCSFGQPCFRRWTHKLMDQRPSFYKDFRADNTVRQHSYAFNSFCKWCFSHNIVNILPFSDVYVAMYLVHLATKVKSVSTLRPTMIYAGHINLQALLILASLTLLYQWKNGL